jgi:hypothetical protein
MLRTEKDYILRMIAAAAATVALLRARLVGGAQPDEIVKAVREAQIELLGPETGLLRALAPESAAHAIGDRERITAWADLLHLEADALAKSGDSVGAGALTRRVVALRDLASAKKEQK